MCFWRAIHVAHKKFQLGLVLSCQHAFLPQHRCLFVGRLGPWDTTVAAILCFKSDSNLGRRLNFLSTAAVVSENKSVGMCASTATLAPTEGLIVKKIVTSCAGTRSYCVRQEPEQINCQWSTGMQLQFSSWKTLQFTRHDPFFREGRPVRQPPLVHSSSSVTCPLEGESHVRTV